MTGLLWTIFVVAELVLVVLAVIGVQKIREDIKRRSMPFDGRLSSFPMNDRASRPAGYVGSTVQESPPTRLALPAPSKQNRRPAVSHLKLKVDNGRVPEYRSRTNFRGKLKAV